MTCGKRAVTRVAARWAYQVFADGQARALLKLRKVAKIMIKPIKTHRVLLALVLYSSWVTGAYGRSSSSLRSLTGQTGETMSFLAWMVLGLIAGFIGSKIVNRRGEGILL